MFGKLINRELKLVSRTQGETGEHMLVYMYGSNLYTVSCITNKTPRGVVGTITLYHDLGMKHPYLECGIVEDGVTTKYFELCIEDSRLGEDAPTVFLSIVRDIQSTNMFKYE